MSRRKGFPRLVKETGPFTDDHPVARSIGRGSRWFDAWVAQRGTPYAALARKSGVAIARLFELSHGAAPTDAEIAALASPWRVTAEGLRESIVLSAKVEGSGQETELTGASGPEIGP
jgi:hypothetical protein